LWSRLTAHFAEDMAACGHSCGHCLGREVEADASAPVVPRDASDRKPQPRPAAAGPPSQATPDPELFERLRALRKALADERKVPAFVVFSDRTLLEMAARKPRTRAALLELFGVGQRKLQEYGESFLAEIDRP
jgi:superfamily II DNA helicase RecQ